MSDYDVSVKEHLKACSDVIRHAEDHDLLLVAWAKKGIMDALNYIKQPPLNDDLKRVIE